MTHKYIIGQRVSFAPGGPGGSQAYLDRFTVVRLMPATNSAPMYRIKGDTETYQRVARESQLESIF